MRRRGPNESNIVIRVITVVVFFLDAHSMKLWGAEHLHLLPIAPFFDTQGEHASQYGEFCETILFRSGAWDMRYYEVIATPSATMGISFYRGGDGAYFIDVRQSTPELKSVIQEVDYETRNFQAINRRINLEKATKRIPASTASEIRRLWLWSLSEVGPQIEEGNTIFMDAPLIILYAKADDGSVLSGKFPPNHQGMAKFLSFRNIVAKLVAACDAKQADRHRLFAEAERASRKLRDAE